MQTLKNIHNEYLKKLAEEIVNKVCISVCKCDTDDSTEKKKCLFRKSVNGSNTVLVDLWFDMIDAVSEVIYTRTVADMAYPELIRKHFRQTKAKSFYAVLSDEFESVILNVYKKVCLRIPDVCRENSGFEELVDYAEKELLEYFTFEKVFSYSRYMIENHSYIEEWFPVADMDTKEILESAKKEPIILNMIISSKNYEYTRKLEDLLEYTYSKMYEKKLGWLKNVFVNGIFNVTCDRYEDDCIVFGKGEDEYSNGLKILIECYQNHGVTREMFYSDVNEKIGHIITGGSNNAKRKKKSFGDIIDEDGNLIKEKIEKVKIIDDEKLAKSRQEIYKSQMMVPNDNMLHPNRSETSDSNGKLNQLIRVFYKDLYGLDLFKIYKKAPYCFEDGKNKKHPLLLPKYIKVVDALLNYRRCKANDKYKMLQEWGMHYNRIKAYDYIFVSSYNGGSEGNIGKIIEDNTIEDKNYYENIYRKTKKINDEKNDGTDTLEKNKKAVRDLIEALTIAVFILSPDYKTLKEVMDLSVEESKKMRGLIDLVFIE